MQQAVSMLCTDHIISTAVSPPALILLVEIQLFQSYNEEISLLPRSTQRSIFPLNYCAYAYMAPSGQFLES